MGQRHQIYIKLPYEFDQIEDWNGKSTVKSSVISLHHQWLYGSGPVEKLIQFRDFYQKGIENPYFIFKENTYQSPEQAASSLYSLDFTYGHYYPVSILNHAVSKNPNLGDNNDGITVIDASIPGELKYCLLFLEEWEPLDAKSYMERYDDENREEQTYRLSLTESLRDIPVLTKDELRKIFPGPILNQLFE